MQQGTSSDSWTRTLSEVSAKRPLYLGGEDKVLALGLLAALGILAVQVVFFYHGAESIFDDAFITFRYSRNLARGLGPVFNPGDPVEGYTNFLWMLILAGAVHLGISAEIASQVLGIASAIALLFATHKLGRAMGLRGLHSLLPVLLLAGTASYARYSVSGMETLFFALWVTLGFALSVSGANNLLVSGLASLVMVMAALARPEGLLFSGCFVVHLLSQRWKTLPEGEESRRDLRLKHLLIWLLPWLLIFLPYFAWRLSYYGYWMPNTFYAKVGTGSLALLRRGVIYLALMIPVVNPQLLLLLLLIPWLRWSSPRRSVMITMLAYFAYVVYVGGDDYSIFGPRLLLPIFPALYVIGASSLTDILQRVRPRWWVPAQVTVGLTTVVILSVYAQTERLAYVQVMQTMTRGWLSAGQWMAKTLPNEALVAVDAAGIIPFYTDLATLDMLGLNDEHIAHLPVTNIGAGLAGHEKCDPAYVISRRPDFVTTWIDRQGCPTSAGLAQYADEFLRDYHLYAIVLMRPPRDGVATVLPGQTFSTGLHDQGYIYGVFSRRPED